MNEIKRAILGNKKAQQAVTERGQVLPCPKCLGEAEIKVLWNKRKNPVFVICKSCGERSGERFSVYEAIEDWNTRPQILTEEELKRLI